MAAPEADEPDGLSPSEAFRLLADETRLRILRALWEADDCPVPFGDLLSKVGYDDSGNFSYHLDQLSGTFVRKGPNGYELRVAGEAVMRAVLAGVITESPSIDPREIGAACPYCGSPVEIRYADEQLTARCTVCEGTASGDYPHGTYMSYPFPPAGLKGRDPEEVLRAARTFYDAKADAMMKGVCPECAGSVVASVDICDDHRKPEDGLCEACDTRYQVWITYGCERCGYTRRSALWYRVLRDPAVIAYYHDRAGDGWEVPFRELTWENEPHIKQVIEEVLSRDPLRVRAVIRLDGYELEVTVDDDLSVIDVA